MGLTKPEITTGVNGVASQHFDFAKFAPCQRRDFSAKETDWIQFKDHNLAGFDICPGCYETSLAHTKYANHFQLVPKGTRSADLQFQCDFGKYWVRIAFVWSLATQQPDLKLLGLVAGVPEGGDGECSNGVMTGPAKKVEAARRWYTIRHPGSQALMEDFTVCDYCWHNVTAILPDLGRAGVFVPAANEPCSGACDISRTKRAQEYVNLLLETAVEAQYTGMVDTQKLVKYIEKYGSFVECPTDGTTTGKHYIMQEVPEFTVCEECFEDIIKPDKEKGAQLAMNFGEPQMGKFSCQVYSSRTRSTWNTAVAKNDLGFLQQKVVERKTKFHDTLMQIEQFKLQRDQEIQQAEMMEQLGLMSSTSTMHHSLCTQIGYGYAKIPDFQDSQQKMAQGAQHKMQAAKIQQQIDFLVKAWNEHYD